MTIKAGDQAKVDGRLVKAIEPYKVKHHWVVRILSGPGAGKTRIMSTGTLALFKVKKNQVSTVGDFNAAQSEFYKKRQDQ